jgi:hypothetical protein
MCSHLFLSSCCPDQTLLSRSNPPPAPPSSYSGSAATTLSGSDPARTDRLSAWFLLQGNQAPAALAAHRTEAADHDTHREGMRAAPGKVMRQSWEGRQLWRRILAPSDEVIWEFFNSPARCGSGDRKINQIFFFRETIRKIWYECLALTGLARLLSADWCGTAHKLCRPCATNVKNTWPKSTWCSFLRHVLDVYKNAYGLYEKIVVSYIKKDRKGCEFLQITMLHFMWKRCMLLQHGPTYGRRWSLSPIERRGWSEWRKQGEQMRWICLSSKIMHIYRGKENCFLQQLCIFIAIRKTNFQ